MTEGFKCDKCGKFFSDNSDPVATLGIERENLHEDTFDFCAECAELLEAWVKQK